jgi:putative OPT family oligopeptide transporter
MQDLKAGQLVGATPYKQQIMQMIGVVAAALVIAPILQLLFQAYGLGNVFPRAGMDPSEALQAPQATLMSSVANGVFSRNLPWGMITVGGLIAVAIIVVDKILESRDAEFRTPVLAVAVGIYLPLELSVAIFIGGMIAFAVSRHLAAKKDSLGDQFEKAETDASRRGLLFSSGLITGEALVGIILAIPFAIFESTDVLRLPFESFGLGDSGLNILTHIVGVAAFAYFIFWLYRVAIQTDH